MASNIDMSQIISKLRQRFGIFSNDQNYYQDIILKALDSENIILEAESLIKADIEKSLTDGNIQWLLNFIDATINNNKDKKGLYVLRLIVSQLVRLKLEIDIDLIRTIITIQPDLEDILDSLLASLTVINEDAISTLTGGRELGDFILYYAALKEKLVDEEIRIDDIPYEHSTGTIWTYIADVKKIPLLTLDEEKYWGKMALEENDGRAIQVLVEHNLSLVVSRAKHFLNRGLSFEDIIQAGNEGLIKAAQTFDYRKGYHFSTHACWWIRSKIERTIGDEGKTIRIPIQRQSMYNKIYKVHNRLVAELGVEPKPEQVARESGYSLAAVEEAIKNYDNVVSLQMGVGDEESSELLEFVVSPEISIEDRVVDGDLREQVADALSTLDDRLEFIIRMRFGIQSDTKPNKLFSRAHTLDEIAPYLNVTRERIRQLEKKAFKVLRNPRNSRYLEPYSYSDRPVAIPTTKKRNKKAPEINNRDNTEANNSLVATTVDNSVSDSSISESTFIGLDINRPECVTDDIYSDALIAVPIEYRPIVSLYYKIDAERQCTVDEIAEIFSKRKEQVVKDIKIGKIFLEEYINIYTQTFVEARA